MKNVEPSIGSSERSRGAASATISTSGAMPTVEETFMDSTATVDPSGGTNDANPTVAPRPPTPLSLTSCHDGVFHDYTSSLWTAS